VKIRNLGNAKNARYQTNVDIKTPIIFTKLKSSMGIRGSKNPYIKATWTYIIPKVMRDSITVDGKVTFATAKSLKKVKGIL